VWTRIDKLVWDAAVVHSVAADVVHLITINGEVLFNLFPPLSTTSPPPHLCRGGPVLCCVVYRWVPLPFAIEIFTQDSRFFFFFFFFFF